MTTPEQATSVEIDDTTLPRLASESPFPYGTRRVCYIERHKDGTLHQIRTKAQMTEAIGGARKGWIDIVAVWPGEHRSDLFLIDDLDALAAARKIR